MVMPNQHDGGSSPGWWDDLPSAVKQRVSRPAPPAGESPRARQDEHHEPRPASYRPAVVYDLSRLAILFFVVALANVLFLLVALSFLAGPAPATN
jgi:hypothetical protein